MLQATDICTPKLNYYMKNFNIRWFTLILLLVLVQCKTTKLTDASKPSENYIATLETPLVSSISVPINILIEELVRNINTSLGGKALYEDYSYDDNGSDGLMMNAWKSQDITMFFTGNTIKYRLPVKLWMKKRLFVGEAEATGDLAISFKTTYLVNPDWSLSTRTEVEYHEWITPPVLKTGIGDIGIETLSNLVINRSKKTLSSTVDRVVSQQMSLKPYLEEIWTSIQEPVLMSEEYKMWVKTTPLKIGMTPMITDWNALRTKITVECLNDVTFGEKPFFRENSKLPDLALLSDTGDDFQMQFTTDVPFPEAERLAKAMMIGQVFESGKKKVRIDDLQIWGQNDRIIILSQLSGSFNGKIYFIGRPKFNAVKNMVEVVDLDFHVDTKNLLYKSASWIFQGPIKKQMAAAMVFPLDENLKLLKTSVQETLNHYEISPGILLTGTLDSIKVLDTRLTPSGIRVDIFSKGKVNVDIK